MDVPEWWGDSFAPPVSPSMGREEALLTNIALTDQATQQQDEDGLVSSASSEPKFRVKRWRKDPAPNFVNPSPKAVATTPKPPLNRWEHGHLSSQYKPPSLFQLWEDCLRLHFVNVPFPRHQHVVRAYSISSLPTWQCILAHLFLS